jgi:hypothetical protein
MKVTLILFFFFSVSVNAAECKITGNMQSNRSLEISFSVKTSEDCHLLATKSMLNNFFGLIEDKDVLLETRESFEEDSGR